MRVAHRVSSVTGLAHDAKRRSTVDHIAGPDRDGIEMSEVVAHTVVADHRDVLATSRRGVVDLRIPRVGRANLLDLATDRRNDVGAATEHVGRRIVVMPTAVADLLASERKDVQQCPRNRRRSRRRRGRGTRRRRRFDFGR